MSGSSSGIISGVRGPIAVLFVVVVALAAVQFLRSSGGVAATPAAFDTSQTLNSAIDEARERDRVVLVVATADWCGPCQAFKRGTLSDPRIEEWIEEHAIGVMLDIDQYPETAERLGVRGVPTTFLIRDGTVVAGVSGNRDAATLHEWLIEQTISLH